LNLPNRLRIWIKAFPHGRQPCNGIEERGRDGAGGGGLSGAGEGHEQAPTVVRETMGFAVAVVVGVKEMGVVVKPNDGSGTF